MSTRMVTGGFPCGFVGVMGVREGDGWGSESEWREGGFGKVGRGLLLISWTWTCRVGFARPAWEKTGVAPWGEHDQAVGLVDRPV